MAHVFVDTEEGLLNALNALASHKEVAFDAEGVNLGRAGPLTIVTLRGIDSEAQNAPAFVVDVMVLGADRAFHTELPSLRAILEDSAVTKVTFDCRTDSDALSHQYSVTIRGVLELQVLDQAVRLQDGEAPPMRCPFVKPEWVPYLQSMQTVSMRYFEADTGGLEAPHATEVGVWGKRPLSAQAVEYAANDTHVISKLLHAMRAKAQLSETLQRAVKEHSARYEGHFRSRADGSVIDKSFIKEEHAIVGMSDLPADHPYHESADSRKPNDLRRWEDAVRQLERPSGDRTQVYNKVLFIRQHDEWYTAEGHAKILALADAFPFTAKQRERIRNPPTMGGDSDDD